MVAVSYSAKDPRDRKSSRPPKSKPESGLEMIEDYCKRSCKISNTGRGELLVMGFYKVNATDDLYFFTDSNPIKFYVTYRNIAATIFNGYNIEIAQGDDDKDSVDYTDEENLTNVLIRASKQKQIFTNDGLTKVLLKINNEKKSLTLYVNDQLVLECDIKDLDLKPFVPPPPNKKPKRDKKGRKLREEIPLPPYLKYLSFASPEYGKFAEYSYGCEYPKTKVDEKEDESKDDEAKDDEEFLE